MTVNTKQDVDVAAKLAEHQAAIDKLLKSQPPTSGAQFPTPRPPEPSTYSKQLAAEAEENRRKRVDQAERERIAREADYAADAPRRAKVEAKLVEFDRKIEVAKVEVSRLESERGAVRRTL